MRRPVLVTAMTLLLATSACGSDEPEDDGIAAATSGAETVPDDRSADLVDGEGSVIGTAVLQDRPDDDVVVRVDVEGLPEGLHDVGLFETADCDAVTPESPVIELPRLSVLDDGVGSLVADIDPSALEELMAGEGAAVVVTGANVDTSADSGNDLPGSYLACGAFSAP